MADLTFNLVFLGDSLTEGVPHYNGETDTVAFQVSQRFPGSTYTKLGYRSQTSDYLLGRLSCLLDLHKPDTDYRNILVLWAGTNDMALIQDSVNSTYNNLSAIARVARAIGWKVVIVTIIARDNYFAAGIDATEFGACASALNDRLRQLQDFDAVADPAKVLTDPGSPMYWDKCHLMPPGYTAVADLVAAAIASIPQ